MKLEGLRRIDVPEIDKAAFREAIINAFCHRDYREYDSVNIAVFKDHIEIRSPGLLYGGLTIETIRTKMVSERRNELIAEMLHRVHFIEKWGRGIRLILSKEPDTEFSEVGTKFVTTFKRRSYIEEVEKGAESWVKKLGEKLGENENRIVEIVVTNKFVTIPELSKMLKISTTAVENNIAKLKAKKILKRIGPDKGGYWEVVKK